jgi:GTP cyclohydrolase I
MKVIRGPFIVGQELVHRQLQFIGENPTREGLIGTPGRVVRAWSELFAGYDADPAKLLKTFDAGGCNQIVLLRDIEMFSMCEHHLLPFFGRAHVAYIPDMRVIGISKLARLVEIYARRLQIQERIGEQVTSALMEHLEPLGAACIIKAQHLCMQMRGVSKQHSVMVTSSLKGVFLEEEQGSAARMELLHLIEMKD